MKEKKLYPMTWHEGFHFESQFAYCPLVGLFHSRALNTKINLLHYRALKFVHQDELSTFQELLIKDNSVSHHRNIHFLAIELFKVISGGVIPENSVVANLRSQTNFYNYHNPQCSIWNRNVTCPRDKDMEYHSTRY